jgi:hypothetical protein
LDALPNELYRAWPDAVRLPAGGGAEAVYVPLSGAAQVLSPERARALLGCQGFATLDQHAARLAPTEQGAMRAQLAELARQGLLVGAGELVRRLREAAPPGGARPPRIAALSIPTRNRPAEVTAALDSHITNAVAHGHALEYAVADGTESADDRARVRDALTALATRHGVAITYIGMVDGADYTTTLARRAGVPREVVEFAVQNPERCPNATGANRNALMLHAAGDLAVQVDDDTRARVAPAPGQLPGLAITSQDYPSESYFPAPGVPALPDRVVVPRSYVALHEELLGRSVSACAEDARRHGLDLEHAGGALFRRLAPGGGRVLCTQTGCAGDSGTGSMWYYLLLSGRSRERLLTSEATYRHAFTSRQVIRAAPRATLSDGLFCMSMSLGLDLRAALPPFLPVQRNSDGVFGVTLRACYRDAFFGFSPWVIEHSPAQQRASSFEDFWRSLGQCASEDTLCALILASRIEADKLDPRKSLRALGATLERWGSLPLADFEEIGRVQMMRARSLDLQLLEAALETHGNAPAFWVRDVQRTATLVRESLTRPSLAHPADLVGTFGEQEARLVMARVVRRFGELLQCWPELVEAAVALRREGVRPGQVLRG